MPDPSKAESTEPKRCSNCQAQLPDTPVSICPYCVMPVGDGSGAEEKESKNTPRLAKVRDSEAFAEAGEIVPPESPAFQHGARLAGVAWTLIIYGSMWLAMDGLIQSVDLWSIPMGLIAAIRPATASAIAEGMTGYLAALPEPLYALFGTGYLGYTVARQWGKANGSDR